MPARSTAWNLPYALLTSATLSTAMVSACARSSSAPADASAPRAETGAWGGEHLELVVTDTGVMLQYDCAHGTMFAAPKPDASGRFVVAGTHVFEHGGPIRVGEAEDRHAATYAGRVLGPAMTLTVQVSGVSATLGPFTLRRGDAGRVYRCY